METTEIYGDLENYDDVNAFEEIRFENTDLKAKLNDYKLKHALLQKDFDRVSAEYKKLEVNYSSLLKTARAEIARKTQIIATLNTEKDKMILNALQNSNQTVNSLRRSIRDKSTNRKSKKDDSDLRLVKQEIKRFDHHDLRERIEEKRLPSTDTMSSGNTEDTNTIANKLIKLAAYDKEDSKENIAKNKRAMSLKSRRKSMPVISKPLVKFSSDEDEDNCSTEDTHPRDWPLREDKGRKPFERHKLSHKISETSGIDEKYSSYHESSRESYYKARSHRYTDKYRSVRDKYDLRYKKHHSPEKRRRGVRQIPEDAYERSEFPRHRVLESPPTERYDAQRRFRGRRTNLEREDQQQNERPCKEMNHHLERPGKHKSTGDYDEPSNKRARTDSGIRLAEEDTEKPTDNKDINEKIATEFGNHLLDISCQSPEYIHHDVVSTQPKEIMTTAHTKLEDPRLVSKRYIKIVDGGSTIVSTLTGRNVDLELLTWNKEVPEVLQRTPHDIDEVAQDLYNFENPVSNMSTESGEIHSESNDVNMIDYVTESFFQDYENEGIIQENAKTNSQFIRQPKIPECEIVCHTEKQQNDDTVIERRLPPVRYKLNRPVVTPKVDASNPLGLLLEQMKEKCGVTAEKAHDSKLDVDQTFGESPLKQEHKEVTKTALRLKRRRKTIAEEIVARDLDLSDETSEISSVKKCDKKEKIQIAEKLNQEQEKGSCIEKKSSKAMAKEVCKKFAETDQPKNEFVEITLEHKENRKTKTNPRSLSPQPTGNLELNKIDRQSIEQPVIEKTDNKTNEKVGGKKGEKKTRITTKVAKTIDKSQLEEVIKKRSDTPELEKEDIDELKFERTVKRCSTKSEIEKTQTTDKSDLETAVKKANANPDQDKSDKKDLSKLEEKAVRTSSAKSEIENLQHMTSDKSDVDKAVKKTSLKREEAKSDLDKTAKKSSAKSEAEKSQKQPPILDTEKAAKKTSAKPAEKKPEKEDICRTELRKTAKKTNVKSEVEKSHKKFCDKPDVEKAVTKTKGKLKEEKSEQNACDKTKLEKTVKKTGSEFEKLEKKILDEPDVEKAVKKTSAKPATNIDDRKFEKSVKKISSASERDKPQKKTHDKSDIQKVYSRLDVEEYEKESYVLDIKTNVKGEEKAIQRLETVKTLKNSSVESYLENSGKETKISKFTKEHDQKSKFSELFGDSCSLITPEDLGVPVNPPASTKPYLPIFEDAQDSVDVSHKMKEVYTELSILPTAALEEDQDKTDNEKGHQSPAVSSTEDKRKEGNMLVSIPIKVPTNMNISNLITKEPVSTVIISTGVQPGIDVNASTKLNNSEKPHQLNIPDGPVAIATSTPFKRLFETEVDICNTSEVGSKKDESSSVNQSNTSNAETQNDDVPDVRIFVRRRRRVKK